MFSAPFRRSLRSRGRVLLILIITVLSADVLCVHYHLQSSRSSEAPITIRDQRIFIASTHWNNEVVLRSHWNSAILDLARALGKDNVYVSILESGSWDNSKAALRELDSDLQKLGVGTTIELNDTTHLDDISRPPAASGWVDTPRGKRELRRIPYLAGIRNRSLQPLIDLRREQGKVFDKILFLNDVIFTVMSNPGHHSLSISTVLCLSDSFAR